MLREEAIAILEAFTENPLFSDVHKAAFNIAIHDIKQRHDWDINNLILINKENYEPAEQESILDKIRAEIDKIYERENHSFDCLDALDELKEFIEKTWAESEK
jgi:hypothetical protein